MTERDNLLSLLKRRGFQSMPVEFSLCPSLENRFKEEYGSSTCYREYFNLPWRTLSGLEPGDAPTRDYSEFYGFELKPGTLFDEWGIAHEPGSREAMHMTRMRHPLKEIDSIDQIKEYPFPDFTVGDFSALKGQIEAIQDRGLAAVGMMQYTIWETAWYLRSMEELMMDMMADEPKAEYLLDRITEIQTTRALRLAEGGVDILYLGDDIGMQESLMMSQGMYRTWLKPRLRRIIQKVKKDYPDLLIMYHTCGFVTTLIEDLIEAGIEVLNPVQPECMDFGEIHAQFGDRLSFHGTIGTQTTMPFGTPEEVKALVRRNLEIAGHRGGLLCSPSHLLEPEVPFRNVIAYTEACREFGSP